MNPRGFAAACLLGFAAAAGAATSVGGVRFEDAEKVGGASLALNGAGMRAVLVLRAYAIGLYLPARKSGADEILAQAGPKRLRLVPLTKLTADQFVSALEGGIEKNHGEAEREALKAPLQQLAGAIRTQQSVAKGTVITLDWLPKAGTRLSINGRQQGEDIPGEAFYRALLRIWLGERPAQRDLKDALLGK